MSIEAAPGKNPLDHSGKLYTVLATRVAQATANQTGRGANVTIVTSKGAPLDAPDAVVVEVAKLGNDRGTVQELTQLTRDALAQVSGISRALLAGEVTLW